MRNSVDKFFDYLYDDFSSKWNEFNHITVDNFEFIKELKQAKLRELIGIDKLICIATDPKIKFISCDEYNDYSISNYSVSILPFFEMPFYVIKPNGDDKTMKILYSHGHGDGGIKDCFIEKNPPEYHKNIPLKLAKRGYTVFCYEPFGFGDFNIKDYKYASEDVDSRCYPITMRLHMFGLHTVGIRVFQAKTLASIMKSEFGVSLFSAVGISGGATVNMFYSALYDDMYANVLSGYSNLFKTSIMAMPHCSDNFIHGILKVGELPHIIALGAPKYLFLSSGSNDPIYPIEGAKASYEIVKSVYDKLLVSNKLKQEIFEGEHEFSSKFIDWLDKLEFNS